jgi:hypothetical protein
MHLTKECLKALQVLLADGPTRHGELGAAMAATFMVLQCSLLGIVLGSRAAIDTLSGEEGAAAVRI